MCHSDTPPPAASPPSDLTHTNSDSNIILAATDSLSRLATPRRKNRTKTRKPKFLSLRLQLSSKQSDPTTHHQQLNLFPLHPENLIHDRDVTHDDNNVALLFTSHGPATLNGLLEQDSTTTTTTNTTVSEEDSMSPPQCATASPFDDEDGSTLVRKALRRRGNEEEERWVCYSEVTSYCSATTTESIAVTGASLGLLSLKLDYEGILNAWSDKGPFYVPSETPLAVPDFLDHVLPHHRPDVGWGQSEKKIGQREASVLRYKEKRQNRLFSKRIRYEVRKLNAQQRPRMKGRFVKRD